MPDHQPIPIQGRTISIILPTYNGDAYLRQSLESCLGQTYKDIELIIIDDASTDRTPQIIASFKDPRIKSIRLDRNGGHIRALNRGFAASCGAFLTWTSDDNWYAPQALETMVAELDRHPRTDFVYSAYHMVDHQGRLQHAGRVENPSDLDVDNCIGGCFLYRRRVYETVGEFNPEAFLAEDYEYWLRVRQEFHMRKIPQTLYYYRQHENSLTGKYKEDRVQSQVKAIRSRFIPSWKQDFFTAQDQVSANNMSEAHSTIGRCLRHNPFYGPAWRLWVLLHLDPGLVRAMRTFKHRFTQH